MEKLSKPVVFDEIVVSLHTMNDAAMKKGLIFCFFFLLIGVLPASAQHNDSIFMGCQVPCTLDINGVPHEFNGTETLKDVFIDPISGSTYDFVFIHAVYDTIVSECNFFKWWRNDSLYSESTVDFWQTPLENSQCRMDTLRLTINKTADIDGNQNLTAATDFWPGTYSYRLSLNSGIDPQSVTWELSDNDGSDRWGLRPNGTYCTVVAYSIGKKELKATWGTDDCSVAKKVLFCSAYAVDENEIAALKVYPNPTKDSFTVKGSGMKAVRLYNLLGQQVRMVDAQGNDEARLDVGDLPQALYVLEVITDHGNNSQLVSVIK